tara:strand:- start:186 stop:470 length:285 start_codon:yes stop_codon:yes gene_type:complete
MSETTTTEKVVETPLEKFNRLALKRGDRFLAVCKLLQNLGDSYAYRINPDLAEELLAKFEQKLEEVKISWTNQINKVRNKESGETSTTEEESED